MTARILFSVFAISCIWCITNACTDGFVRLDKGCYYFSNENSISWFDALTNCGNRNSQLVSIETIEESFAINLHLHRKHGHNRAGYWTSGSDAFRHGHYTWMTKGKPFAYVGWCQHEPNNAGGNEHCVHLLYESNKNTCWNDANCYDTHVDRLPMQFICEREQ